MWHSRLAIEAKLLSPAATLTLLGGSLIARRLKAVLACHTLAKSVNVNFPTAESGYNTTDIKINAKHTLIQSLTQRLVCVFKGCIFFKHGSDILARILCQKKKKQAGLQGLQTHTLPSGN